MDAKEFQKAFRENSLMLHGHPNHFGVPSATAQDRLFDCASLLRRSGWLKMTGGQKYPKC